MGPVGPKQKSIFTHDAKIQTDSDPDWTRRAKTPFQCPLHFDPKLQLFWHCWHDGTIPHVTWQRIRICAFANWHWTFWWQIATWMFIQSMQSYFLCAEVRLCSHWTQHKIRGKLGCENPVVATTLSTLHAPNGAPYQNAARPVLDVWPIRFALISSAK